MPQPFVAQLTQAMLEPLRQGLEAQNFEFSTPAYTIFSAKKKGISVTVYQSLKMTVQGKEMAPFIEYFLEPEILKTFSFSHPAANLDLTARLGVDEAGKGDFFGPLCIAALYAEGKEIEKLFEIGVRDSKTLGDPKILTLSKQLKQICAHEIIRIGPARYNELYEKFGNLNTLLAWGHATAIEKLVARTKCPKVVIDKFAHEHVVASAIKRKNLTIDLVQKVRAEEDLVVAAASILARAAFVEGIDALSKEYGIELPKGASQKVLETGKTLVKTQGRDVLPKVAKIHFRTTEQILQL